MTPQNPFDGARLRPGAMPYLFRQGESAAALVEKLRVGHWRGQIVGPHGSGKSSLLQALLPALREAGREVVPVRFQGGVLVDESEGRGAVDWNSNSLVIVDGFEQLGWIKRWFWKLSCRQRKCGLLVTAHQSVGLPTIAETNVDAALAERVVAQLLGDDDSISSDEVQHALQAQRGNLRDALFALYDLYEQRRKKG